MNNGARICGLDRKGEIPYSRLVVPALLMVGWIVGCVLMVYIVFS
ncbi:sarcoplasmic/endoplasmic reticulum calcium ATPase regulator DWORF isoform X1 [Chelonia mydas]|nr:sarcoplasmic/endoplasmic reticulum calcium ATPase regulator DWORF isoform X1 [Chelonia mydas]